MYATAQSTTSTSETNAFGMLEVPGEKRSRPAGAGVLVCVFLFLVSFCERIWAVAEFGISARDASASRGGEDARGDAAVLALMRWRAGVLDMPDCSSRLVTKRRGTLTESTENTGAGEWYCYCQPYEKRCVSAHLLIYAIGLHALALSTRSLMRRQRDLDCCRGVVSATVANFDGAEGGWKSERSHDII